MNYIVGTIDLALISLYAFWAFFAGLVIYLVRESMREGYPTVSETTGKPLKNGTFFGLPNPKTYLRRDGTTIMAPREEAPEPEAKMATPRFSGAAGIPTGDPLADGVGPAAWTNRPDVPDMNFEGHLRIKPISTAEGFWLEERDTDPRGLPVECFDGEEAGTVTDVWIDTAEYIVRYIEVQTTGGKKVLVPMNLVVISGMNEVVKVRSVSAAQLAGAPATKDADRITLLEEDKISAYFTGGTLYATPARAEPLI